MGTIICCRQDQQHELVLETPQILDKTPTLTELSYQPEIEQSVIKIQAAFRGSKIRKEFDVQRQQIRPHKSIAWPTDRNEYSNNIVRRQEDKLGLYDFSQNKSLPGCQTLEPHEFKTGAIYIGQWKDGKRWGNGKQNWPDGSIYEGGWIEDRASGHGRLIHSNGDVYIGQWKNDKSHGFGIYYHSDGSRYEGEWFEDKQHGKGKEIWADSAVYEGEFNMGQKEGFGWMQWNDGAVFEGQFSNNAINGQGTYKWQDLREYTGEWSNNQMHGKGIFKWPDGKLYEGIQYRLQLEVIYTIKKKDTVSLLGQMGEFTKESGSVVNNMEKELQLIKMVRQLLASGRMDKKFEFEYFIQSQLNLFYLILLKCKNMAIIMLQSNWRYFIIKYIELY